MKTASCRLGGSGKMKRNLGKHIIALICTGLLRFLSSWSPALKTQELPLITQQLFHFQPQFFYHCPLTVLSPTIPFSKARGSPEQFLIYLQTHIQPLCLPQPFSQHLYCFQREALSSTKGKKTSCDSNIYLLLWQADSQFLQGKAQNSPLPLHLSWCDKE